MKVKYLILNLDGVLFLTQKKQKEIWQDVLSENNIPEDLRFFIRWFDVGHPEKEHIAFQYYKQHKLEEEMYHRYHSFLEQSLTNKVPLYDDNLIDYLLSLSLLKIAVISSNPKKLTSDLINTLPSNFEIISMVTQEDAIEGHPQPHLYLKTLHQLNAKPHECIAIESSRHGLQAAYLAGIPALFLEGTFKKYDHEDLIKYSMDQCRDLSLLKERINLQINKSASE